MSKKQEFISTFKERGEPGRPTIRTAARRIQYNLPPYRQNQPSTGYSQPGKGVSGETTN
ncbi:MAG TPA: hypothetical protein VLA89_15205 [Gemmatimonadales bacterium]|nr:hypothetical protein [Gemmatimonadales bacterium]